MTSLSPPVISPHVPVTLITGPVGSGKTTRLFGLLRDALKRGQAFYVVPNESIASGLGNAYLENHPEPAAITGNVFVSLTSFTREIAGPGKITLSPQSESIVCLKLLKGQRLKFFNREKISFGIAKEAASTISELKRNLIDPLKLRSMLETRGSLKEFDLLNLYESYDSFLAQFTLHDRAGLPAHAIKNIEYGVGPKADTKAVIFDEFFLPEPILKTLVERIKSGTPNLDIFIALPEAAGDRGPFASFASKSIEEFEAIADEHIRLTHKTLGEATINVLELGSPLKEARFCIAEIARETGQATLCFRGAGTEAQTFLDEIGGPKRDTALSCSLYGTATPIIADLLSGEISKRLPVSASLSKMAEVMMDVIRDIDNEAWVRHLEDATDRMVAARSFSSVVRLDEMLHTIFAIDRLLNVGAIDREAFLELVGETTSPSGHPEMPLPNLEFSNFTDSTASSLERLFIPAMVEGTYPSKPAERLFFSDPDELSAKPNKLLDDVFPRPERHFAREAFLFHTWLSKTKNEVFLTYPAVNESGGENVRSSLITEFGPPLAVDAPLPFPSAASRKGFERFVSFRIAIENERAGGNPKTPEYHGIMTSGEARMLVRHRYSKGKFSASGLEKYAECPFEFFVEKVLGLAPEEEVTREIVPKDRGTIIHTILENFYRDHIKLFKEAMHSEGKEAEIKEVISGLTHEAFERHQELIRPSSPVLHIFEKRAIITATLQVVMKELKDARELPSPLFPYRCEWIFGDSGTEGFKLPIEGDSLALIGGRVDRIDLTEDKRRFVIVDYKTGKNISSVSGAIMDGTHVQLPLYVAAVKRLLLTDTEPLGGLLLAVMTAEKKHGFLKKHYNETHYLVGKRMSSLLDEDKWEEALNSALTHASRHVSAIRNGQFARTDKDCAHHCKWSDICRKRNG